MTAWLVAVIQWDDNHFDGLARRRQQMDRQLLGRLASRGRPRNVNTFDRLVRRGQPTHRQNYGCLASRRHPRNVNTFDRLRSCRDRPLYRRTYGWFASRGHPRKATTLSTWLAAVDRRRQILQLTKEILTQPSTAWPIAMYQWVFDHAGCLAWDGCIRSSTFERSTPRGR